MCIKRIWHKITYHGWCAIKLNQKNQIANSCQYVLFVLDGLLRWEVSGHIATVLCFSRICSKQHEGFWRGSHLSSFPSVLLVSRWCNHTIVLPHLQLGKITFYFIRDIRYVDIAFSQWDIAAEVRELEH